MRVEPGAFRIRSRSTIRKLQLPLSEFRSQFAVHLAFLTVLCQRFVHCTILGWHFVSTVPTHQVKLLLYFLIMRYASQSCEKRLLESPFLSVHLSALPDLETRFSRDGFLWNRRAYMGAFTKTCRESSNRTKITGTWHEYPSTFMNTLVINLTMVALYRRCKYCTAYMFAVGTLVQWLVWLLTLPFIFWLPCIPQITKLQMFLLLSLLPWLPRLPLAWVCYI